MYAQTNYLQVQGRVNPKTKQPPVYPIAAVGCLLTAFCNLEERFGRGIDPVGLNAVFRDRAVYGDVDDKIYDDLAWSSIVAYDPRLTVVQTGDGAPTGKNANNSIVKFIYQSFSKPWLDDAKTKKNIVTHFSLVLDAAKGIIIDSWDGKQKSWSAYGGPKAYASYSSSNPQPVAPVSAPSPAANTGKQLFLPASAGYWRIYNPAGPYVVGKEIHKLWPGNPQWAPGLTYDIIRTIAPNIYLIHTESKGDVAIYAGPDTVAQFKDKPAPVAAAPTISPVSPENTTVTVATPTPPIHVEVAEPAPSWPEVVPVVPVDWHKVDTKLSGIYRAKAEITIKDADGLAMPVIMHKDDKVTLAGTFKPQDTEFGISVKSVKNHTWYAIPIENLEPVKSDIEQEEELGKVLDELFGKQDSEEATKPIVLPASKNTIRNALSKFFGYLAGIGDRVSGKNKNKELGK